jgi:RNA 3'-terminal phosphate cyclase (ATP)
MSLLTDIGTGLKSQHVTSIAWLAAATGAEVSGLEVGSHTLEFRPARGPALFLPRGDGSDDGVVRIIADSPAASALLVFQAVFPFLLFASASRASSASARPDEVIELEISGGTNVSWSPSYEYVDQVLLPALEDRFGVRVERRLEQRGWSAGGQLSHGRLRFGIRPLRAGETLKPRSNASGGATDPKGVESFNVGAVDASVIVPRELQEPLTRALARDLEAAFPAADVNFKVLEDSEHEARVYVLLVARSGTLRWGRDLLLAEKRKGRTATAVAQDISRRVTRELEREVAGGREVDEFLQDQLVVFQALAEGRTHFPEGMEVEDDDEESGDERDVRGAKEAVAA